MSRHQLVDIDNKLNAYTSMETRNALSRDFPLLCGTRGANSFANYKIKRQADNMDEFKPKCPDSTDQRIPGSSSMVRLIFSRIVVFQLSSLVT